MFLVIILFPILLSKSLLAFFATSPPYLAISRVAISPKSANINSMSLTLSLKNPFLKPLCCLYSLAVKQTQVLYISFVKYFIY